MNDEQLAIKEAYETVYSTLRDMYVKYNYEARTGSDVFEEYKYCNKDDALIWFLEGIGDY